MLVTNLLIKGVKTIKQKVDKYKILGFQILKKLNDEINLLCVRLCLLYFYLKLCIILNIKTYFLESENKVALTRIINKSFESTMGIYAEY